MTNTKTKQEAAIEELKKYIPDMPVDQNFSGSLDLSSVTSIPEGFNPTVGGDLDLRGITKYIGAVVSAVEINVEVDKNFTWVVRDRKYAKIDGLFCELLTAREWTKDGKAYIIHSAKNIGKGSSFFIVNSGKYYAHGNDLNEAFSDLEFKIVSDKLKNSPITENSLITVGHYRAITGACDMGCRNFLEKNGIPYTVENGKTVEKGPIKAKDLLKILEKSNAYGIEKFKKLIITQLPR